MNSIAQDTRKSELISAKTRNFFRRFRIAGILKSANAYKGKGIPVVQIFMMAFAVVFQNRSLYMQMHLNRDALPFAKDTFYRFMNSCHANWRKFTMLLCSAIIRLAIEPLTSESRRNVLIVDDSLFHRARSKKVELLARVYDHAKGEYTFGFRMLTLVGWSDGNTFLPRQSHSRLHREQEEPHERGFGQDRCPYQRSQAEVACPEKGHRVHALHAS